ncbi:unnamed protein product [Lactuca saligna]|uniref:Uncharacterized protein n=1 Tax=Lactuca saligna TaxID=75948 RepID=A0AA35Z8F4_LACSI|nr:unnamed protein product [Lactuca saligna]
MEMSNESFKIYEEPLHLGVEEVGSVYWRKLYTFFSRLFTLHTSRSPNTTGEPYRDLCSTRILRRTLTTVPIIQRNDQDCCLLIVWVGIFYIFTVHKSRGYQLRMSEIQDSGPRNVPLKKDAKAAIAISISEITPEILQLSKQIKEKLKGVDQNDV